jgi:hypothetical protein
MAEKMRFEVIWGWTDRQTNQRTKSPIEAHACAWKIYNTARLVKYEKKRGERVKKRSCNWGIRLIHINHKSKNFNYWFWITCWKASSQKPSTITHGWRGKVKIDLTNPFQPEPGEAAAQTRRIPSWMGRQGDLQTPWIRLHWQRLTFHRWTKNSLQWACSELAVSLQ